MPYRLRSGSGAALYRLNARKKLRPFIFQDAQQQLRARRQIGAHANEYDDGAFHRGFLERHLSKVRDPFDVFKGLPGQESQQVGFADQARQQRNRSGLDLHPGQGQVSRLKGIVYPAPRGHGGRGQHPAVLAQVAHLIAGIE